MNKEQMLDLLRKNVIPALGCTEPVTIALAAADAAKAAGGEVKNVEMSLSRNMYKNGMSVGIAGFDKVGLEYAAALGALIADTSAQLEIMDMITPEIAAKASALAENGSIKITVDEDARGIYAKAIVRTTEGEGLSIIKNGHVNIILTQKNGETIFSAEEKTVSSAPSPLESLLKMSFKDIRTLACSASEDELAFLMDGVVMNQRLADYIVNGEGPGIGLGAALKKDLPDMMGSGLIPRVLLRVASATEARLDGCPYSTMSSAGSGSKGIATILPTAMTAQELGKSHLETLHALAFAHLINEYINASVGKLSAVCACAMASATASAAAITHLMGGTDEQIGFAVRNMTGTISGMVCDGGKVGCALKLSNAVAAAFTSAILAMNQVGLRPTDGICGSTPEACIANMGRLSSRGMGDTDREILAIMLEKNC